MLVPCGWLWRWSWVVGRGNGREEVGGFAGRLPLEARPHPGMVCWCERVVEGLQFTESDLPLMQFAEVSRSSFSVRKSGIERCLLVDADLLNEAMSFRT